MVYLVGEISVGLLHDEFAITDVQHIAGHSFVIVEKFHVSNLINIKDIYFGAGCAGNMYTNKNGHSGCVIDGAYDRCNSGLYRYFSMVDDSLYFHNTKVHVRDIFFSMPNKLYQYPLHHLVWLDIRIHYMLMMDMNHTLTDIQKLIRQWYLTLINDTLQPSFKLF